MATESPEKEIHLSPLMADIFTARAKESAWIHDRVHENQEREIAEWKQRFVKLFDAVAHASETVDSARIERILDRFAFSANEASKK